MDSTILRIASYNSKGHSSERINYMNNLLKSNDVLFVQEHWYLNSQLSDLSALLDNVNVIGTSGMNDNEIRSGRPYGGCAIVYNKQIKCTVTPIDVDNKRCVAAIMTTSDCVILLVTVYMPCDCNTGSQDSVYNDILHDINLIINRYPYVNHVIVGGDFNTDMIPLVAYSVAE